MRRPSGLQATARHSRCGLRGPPDRGARLHVPDPHRPVVVAGGDTAAVRAPGDAEHPDRVALEGLADRGAGLGIPDPQGRVLASGGDAAAVGAPGHARDAVRRGAEKRKRSGRPLRRSPRDAGSPSVLPETMRRPSGLHATLRRARVRRDVASEVSTARRVCASQIPRFPSPPAVTRRRPSGLHAMLEHSIRRAVERLAYRRSALRAPEPQRAVIVERHDALPVGAPRHAHDGGGVSFEGHADGGVGVGVPETQRVVGAAGEDAAAVGAPRDAQHGVTCAPRAGVPGWPLTASQRRSVPSALPETIRRPSGLHATLDTWPVCPWSGATDGLAGVRVQYLDPFRLRRPRRAAVRRGSMRRSRARRTRLPGTGLPATRAPVRASQTCGAGPPTATMRCPSALHAKRSSTDPLLSSTRIDAPASASQSRTSVASPGGDAAAVGTPRHARHRGA